MEDRDILDSPITQAGIETAIRKMAAGKTPGEDGLGIEFYKCFKDQLLQYLVLLYNEVLESESMPP